MLRKDPKAERLFFMATNFLCRSLKGLGYLFSTLLSKNIGRNRSAEQSAPAKPMAESQPKATTGGNEESENTAMMHIKMTVVLTIGLPLTWRVLMTA